MTIEELIDKCSYFNHLKNTSDIFSELNNIDKGDLEVLELSWRPDKVFRPVVLLRYLLLLKVLKKEIISKEIIDRIKADIEARNVSHYYDFSEVYIDSLKNYKNSNRGMFHQWKDSFPILYPFFNSSGLKESVSNCLNELGEGIIEKYNIENASIHVVGFDGSQNYGADFVWGAVIPEQADNVQKAYQIFFRISSTGINGGLFKGHKLSNNEFQTIDNFFESWEDYLKSLDDIVPKWKEYNSNVNFTLHADEKEFIKRLKQSDYKNIQLYFNSLDRIIDELQIPDEDNLIFSTSRNRLSFHIGLRYCLAINKNQFGFISSNRLQIIGINEEPFIGDPKAFWYSKANIETLLENFDVIVEGASNELNKGYAAKNESYKNVAFRKAVFDNKYRYKLFNQYAIPAFNGNVWKLGCQWGEKSTTSFYPFLLENNLVIGLDKYMYQVGDLVAITDGFKVKAIALIKESPVSVTNSDSLKESLINYGIDYEDYVNIASAEIIELNSNDQFDYKLISGIRKVQKKEVREKIIDLWYRFNALPTREKSSINNKSSMKRIALNQILYGPPGTGKTFNTVNYALEICGVNTIGLSRKDIKKLFEEKVDEGQIVFTTFHQSMTYEDFVEGIKPVEPEKEGDPVIYRVEEGIFRRMCTEASFALAKENETSETENVLDFSLAYDSLIHDLEERLAHEDRVELPTKNGGKVLVDSISSQGNILVKHVGGSRNYTVSKPRLTKIQKVIPDLDNVNNINDEFRAVIGGSNTSAYWAILNAIRSNDQVPEFYNKERKYTWEEKKEVVQSLKKEDYKGKKGKPFVLIIDEINRGNVSQIFGELITLIEEDKRFGNEESIELQLPYSKERFGVPPNLYILGTMNTADRSVEALDTALRRRFSFSEMPPVPRIIKEKGKVQDGIVENIDLADLLSVINKRIEKLLDKDHMIGHSYFLSVGDLNDLKMVFKNKIIPLLQEYFFGDYGKIGLVIGSGFFKEDKQQLDDTFFAPFEDYEYSSLVERKVFHLCNVAEVEDEDFKKAINTLFGNK